MADSLPLQVLQNIFKLLHQRDKVECMTVCRSWKDVIENGILFETVCLQNTTQFNLFMSRMRLDLFQSDNVKRLILLMRNINAADIDRLPFLFTNVQDIRFLKSVGPFIDLPKTNASSPHPWTDTMKCLHTTDQMLSDCILTRGLCCNLTELKLCGFSEKPIEERLAPLVNAPNLRILTLVNYSLSLTNLEELHDNLPLLNSLTIDSGWIHSKTVSTSIHPARFLTQLKLINVSVPTVRRHIKLQKYLNRKYKLVKDLTYDIRVRGYHYVDKRLRRLLSVHVKRNKRKLTTLEIPDINNFRYIFPLLDKRKCKIKTFVTSAPLNREDYKLLLKSNQARSIQTLSLLNISNNYFMHDFTTLTALSELKLSTYSYDLKLNLNWILAAVGRNLKTLEIASIPFEIYWEDVRTFWKLKNLKLKKCSLPERFDIFIIRSFPKLRTLLLHDCNWYSEEFNLSSLDLYTLDVKFWLRSSQNYVAIRTLENKKERYYKSKKMHYTDYFSIQDDSTLCPAVRSSSTVEEGLPTVTFILNSLKTFCMINTTCKSL